MITPTVVALDWPQQFRIVSSEFPPINFFERLVESILMEALTSIESLTNDCLRDEVGDISLVAAEDRLCGDGFLPVMAAFTHTSHDCPSRFSDGSYGVYYAARSLATAIEESKHHRKLFLSYTAAEPGQIDIRVYVGQIEKPLHDIRSAAYDILHYPNSWLESQNFAQAIKDSQSWGLVYRSVRDQGGDCIAAFRPPAVSIPQQGPHLTYIWDSNDIIDVYQKTKVI